MDSCNFVIEKKQMEGPMTESIVAKVQRDYARIIQKIGTPARIPKPQGKSPGRQRGVVIPHRRLQPVVRKTRPMAARC